MIHLRHFLSPTFEKVCLDDNGVARSLYVQEILQMQDSNIFGQRS